MPASRGGRALPARGRHQEEAYEERGRGRLPPRRSNKGLVLGLAAGAVVLLVVVIAVVASQQQAPGKGGKKGGASETLTSGSGPTAPIDTRPDPPPDVTAKDIPRSKEATALQKELKEKLDAYPQDLAAVPDDELEKLIADWGDLRLRILNTEYGGIQNDKREDVQTASARWQAARDEKEERGKKKK